MQKTCHIYQKRADTSPSQANAYAIEDYTDFGSVQRAAEINRDLFLDEWNKGYIKGLTYQGYELSWAVYDTLYHRFSFPVTQIEKLWEEVKNYEKIVLHNIYDPYDFVLKHLCFNKKLEIKNRSKIFEKIKAKKLFLIFTAFIIAIIGIAYFTVSKRKIAVWSSDMIYPGTDSDFRVNKLYENLRVNNLRFLEFVRLNDISSLFKNFFIRKRLVIYYQPIIYLFSPFIIPRKLAPKSIYNSALLSCDRDIRLAAKVIPIFRAIYKLFGIRSLWTLYFTSRNVSLVIAAKCSGIKTVGMKHGAGTKSYDIFEFIPAYSSEKKLGPDVFGVWSAWWQDYFRKYSKIFAEDSVRYAGLLRPYTLRQISESSPAVAGQKAQNNKIKIMLLSEPLTDPKEIAPYLKVLLRDQRFSVAIKIRPMIKDLFYEELLKLMPEVKFLPKYSGNIFEDGKKADVFLGSHTTALLEASLINRLSIFVKTQKWGDYFDLSDIVPELNILVEDPKELPQNIILRINQEPKLKTIEKIKTRYFGENKDGAKWAVSELNI